MLKTFALVGFAAALALSTDAAFAVSGNSSSFGTDGYGPTVPTQSLSNFDRQWNYYNGSKRNAEASAEWLREHGKHFPFPF